MNDQRNKIISEILPTKVLFKTSKWWNDVLESGENLRNMLVKDPIGFVINHPYPKMKSKEFYKKKIEEFRSYDELEFGIYQDLIAYCTPDDEKAAFSQEFVDRSLREMDSIVKQRLINLEKLIDAIEISLLKLDTIQKNIHIPVSYNIKHMKEIGTSMEFCSKVVEIFVLDDCNSKFSDLVTNYSAAAAYDPSSVMHWDPNTGDWIPGP